MNEQTAWWVGEGGDAYTQRNRVDWRKRIQFWEDVMAMTGARSVFEVGCNAGWNLSAINAAAPFATLYGADVNMAAANQAGAALGTKAIIDDMDIAAVEEKLISQHWHFEPTYELVFTAGVLIHLAPEHLRTAMKRIAFLSCDYVLAVEYEAPSETAIQYRGRTDLLWKRDYGRLYEGLGLGLSLEKKWHAGKDQGFDNCTAWLLRKH